MGTNSRLLPTACQAWNHIPLNLLQKSYINAQVRPFSSTACRHPGNSLPNAAPLEDFVRRTTIPGRGQTPSPHLTHLNKFGEARMVNITSKEVTLRTATAECRLYFTQPDTARLIDENHAKKGDVLAAARIAGIMAAKRTSELIPLSHPIPINHVTISLWLATSVPPLAPGIVVEEHVQAKDVQAEATHVEVLQDSEPWAGTGQEDAHRGLSSTTSNTAENDAQPNTDGAKHGHVNIRAIVSSEGKTGVEMEALTAASIAALTVYDMCKAVDRGMRISHLRVTKKTGGKSGTWVDGAPKK